MVSVAFNPSHLEAVDPVVEGIVRPKQDRLGDTERERVIPILIHGDAAFAGQGVVAETLNLSQLDGYSHRRHHSSGHQQPDRLHHHPDESRSTPYSTDVARMVQAPIFHVNGDDPEACIRVAQMAYDYRQQFKKDVVIDMFCYRRHGHNEADDPSYTQPILYRKIREHPSVAVQYARAAGARRRDRRRTKSSRCARHVPQRLNEAYDAAQEERRAVRSQELSAVPTEEIEQLRPRTAVEPADARARDPRHHRISRRISTCIRS